MLLSGLVLLRHPPNLWLPEEHGWTSSSKSYRKLNLFWAIIFRLYVNYCRRTSISGLLKKCLFLATETYELVEIKYFCTISMLNLFSFCACVNYLMAPYTHSAAPAGGRSERVMFINMLFHNTEVNTHSIYPKEIIFQLWMLFLPSH